MFEALLVAAQVGSSVDVGQLVLLGVGGVLGLTLIGALGQFGLQYLGIRSLNNQFQLGMQGVVGINNLRAVDEQQDDGSESGN